MDQANPGQHRDRVSVFFSSGVQSVLLHCVHFYVAVKIYFY